MGDPGLSGREREPGLSGREREPGLSGREQGYPVVLRLAGRSCLVVGGGPVAARKVRGLVAAGAPVTVVAPELSAEMEAAVVDADGAVVTERRRYRPTEAADHRLVVTATGDHAVDQQVFEDAERAGVWCNSADDPERCSFTLPAVHRSGPVTVAVATDGESPALASWLRDSLAPGAGPAVAEAASLLAAARADVKASGRSTESLNWRSVLDSGLVELVAAGDLDEARRRLAELTR